VKNYDPAMSFDDEVATMYADLRRGDEEAIVDFLVGLAGPGPALELAVGTGRIAIPLAARGIPVDGIDISAAMLEQLRARPGGERIGVTQGNFADVPIEGSYRLIYIVWNTLFNLLTQNDQVRCFENVAKHLADDGAFVIEGQRPDQFYRLRDHQYVDAEAVEVDEVRLDVARYDPLKQLLVESHVHLSNEGVRVYPIVTRYIWPSEMDLMARIAGLRLKERWADWDRSPQTAESRNVISVYGR
jgi:SAM-dependent methyltransferase